MAPLLATESNISVWQPQARLVLSLRFWNFEVCAPVLNFCCWPNLLSVPFSSFSQYPGATGNADSEWSFTPHYQGSTAGCLLENILQKYFYKYTSKTAQNEPGTAMVIWPTNAAYSLLMLWWTLRKAGRPCEDWPGRWFRCPDKMPSLNHLNDIKNLLKEKQLQKIKPFLSEQTWFKSKDYSPVA